MPECPSIQEHVTRYLLRSFDSAKRHFFKIFNRLDWLLAERNLGRHWTLLKKCHLPDSVCSTWCPGPFCVLASPAFASATGCNEAVYSLRFDGRCYFLPPILRQGLLRAVPFGTALGRSPP